ncbi:MAG: HK97 family phage prohead protease [Clostridiales bacterium]|nr:HK97 family phage prohead protease [Clostridiales bacterium]
MASYDFSGYATRANIKCTDGRVIMKDAFLDNDGGEVPLVWNHQHNDPDNTLGHALLENRDDGVYAYCSFNNTDKAKIARELVEHGDVTSLSIYANQLKQNGANVIHGLIREVSLVLAGANKGAVIDSVIRHGELSEEEAVIYPYENITICHADDEKKGEEKVADTNKDEKKSEGKTVGDVLNSLNEEQKNVVFALIGQALEDGKGDSDKDDDEKDDGEASHSDEGGNNTMKHNVFDNTGEDMGAENTVLSHSDMMDILNDAKRYGTLKESALQHGIEDIEYLFPDEKNLNTPPEWIKRDTGWVSTVMNGVHHTPFSRIKSMFGDLTADEARARGYIKGNMKKEQVFTLLKRSTTPQTIYKKQKLDRDDIIDITDFDVVAWIKTEMRFMLDEEIARAVLIGDGRDTDSDDKIQPLNIRPIWTDDDLYTIKYEVTPSDDTADARAKAFIRGAIKSRKDYKGSGNPVLFTTEDMLTDCLLLEDAMGRVIYDTEEKLKTALRVSKIVTVEVMENQQRTNDSGTTLDLLGLIVNLSDYNVGADKGGAVNMFDDFDIDYNKYTYLIETRCSGALIKPYSAIAIEVAADTEEETA